MGGADLSYANLKRANLSQIKKGGGYLFGADLSEANLRNSELYTSIFDNANLSYADLSGADLRRANFSGANLQEIVYNEKTQWLEATYNEKTKFPENFEPTEKGMIFNSQQSTVNSE